MGDPQGIPTNTPDQFPAQAEGLGGPCGTRGTPTLYGAIGASNLAQGHLKPHSSNFSMAYSLATRTLLVRILSQTLDNA